MANYSALTTAIQSTIKTNGNNEITGAILQSALTSMITSLGDGYQFKGVATTATNPGSPDQKVFYLAKGPGTFTNFGGLTLADGEIGVLYWDSSWHKGVLSVGGQFVAIKGETTYEEIEDAISAGLSVVAKEEDGSTLYSLINDEGTSFRFVYVATDTYYWTEVDTDDVWSEGFSEIQLRASILNDTLVLP